MSFIRINNRKNFLLKEIPSLHPESAEYVRFWKLQKKRCIEGLWSKDDASVEIDLINEIDYDSLGKGNWRFQPGNSFFYVNFGTILHKPEDAPKSAPKKKIRPNLRDTEWELFYNWLECRGFSGFSDDEEYSCNTGLLDILKDPRIKLDKTCYNSEGKLKNYINPREYLRKLHDKPLGIPLYQNPAKDLFLLGARGIGKSFSVGVGIILYELLFDGAKVYDEETIKNPYKVEIFVGAGLSSKSSELLEKTKQALNLLPGSWGENTDDYKPSPFFKQMAGNLDPNNMKNVWRHEYKKKVGSKWVTGGSGSNIKHGIYTTENPEAAAGGRYSVAVVEEWGLLGNSLAVHGSNTATLMEYPWKFGSSIWIGTGGNVEKIQEAEIMFRDPEAYDALAFDDEFEGSGKIGWFIPAYYAMDKYKDENGNTDVEAALAEIESIREKKRKAKDPTALALEMMNYPIKPSEMFLNAQNSIFPQAMIKSHLAEVLANPYRYGNSYYYVDLQFDSKGELKIEHINGNAVEVEYPIKTNKDRPGVICLFEMPKKDHEGNVIRNRYLQGTDTYDDDESVTNSLGSTFVLDSFTDRIVAEYTGRRDTEEFYEITRKLNILYACEHNYEQNKKGLYAHYNVKNSVHLLCDTPEILRDVGDITISKVGNKRKGTVTSAPVTSFGMRNIVSWLKTPAYGEDEESNILNLHKIGSVGLLREMLNYNGGNADRISAMIMLMILRADKLKNIETRRKNKVKQLSEDNFFNRNFNRHEFN